jgi:peptide/nickel transport system permease protein
MVTGFSVALLASAIGLTFGVIAGYFRMADRVMMPVVDGMMAIPGVLLAVALVSLLGGGLATVIIAIAIPEIPRMIRLARGVTLSVREQAFVSAAVSIGTPTPLILWRHITPNTVPTVTVQATYACASAIITEAVLSFLGVGGSTLPSWGQMIAEARSYIQTAPWLIAFPGLFLSLLVLSVNVLGDQLRDILDPRVARRTT